MKTSVTKKIFSSLLLVSVMFITTYSSAQNCPTNKVYACRYNECGVQECKCINPSLVSSWTAQIPKCNWFHPNCCTGWRVGENETGMGIKNVHPNPVLNSTTISFSVDQTQDISLRIFDVNGRLVSTIADNLFEEGTYEIMWSAENLNSGIYFLQFQSLENQERIIIMVTK